jgi:hypothetical protein
MSGGIVRVYGEAILPPIVWPAHELDALFATETPRICSRNALSLRESTTWERKYEQVFARANGLTVHRGRWPSQFATLDFMRGVMPLVDHFVLFRAPHTRRITAVLSLDYNLNRNFSRLGDHVVVDRLPRSWYWRGGFDHTTAFLLRPAVTP